MTHIELYQLDSLYIIVIDLLLHYKNECDISIVPYGDHNVAATTSTAELLMTMQLLISTCTTYTPTHLPTYLPTYWSHTSRLHN